MNNIPCPHCQEPATFNQFRCWGMCKTCKAGKEIKLFKGDIKKAMAYVNITMRQEAPTQEQAVERYNKYFAH